MSIHGGMPDFSMNSEELELYHQITSKIDLPNFSPNLSNFGFQNNQKPLSLMNKFIFKFSSECKNPQLYDKTFNEFLKIFCPTIASLPLEEKIKFAKESGQQADFAIHMIMFGNMADVFKNLSSFELNHADLLKICKLIIKNRQNDRMLFYNFNKFNLQNTPIEQHLLFCDELSKIGDHEATLLANNFNKLGFIERIKSVKDLDQRINICLKIIEQGDWAAEGIADNFEELGLEKATDDQRFELCLAIVKAGKQGAGAVVRQFDTWGLDNAPINLRLDLCNEIIKQGEVELVLYNFNNLGLTETSVDQRLAISSEIIKQGNRGSELLLKYFSYLGLENATLDQRLLLYNMLAGQDADTGLIFDKLNLLESISSISDINLRLDNYKKIIAQGFNAASAFADRLDRINLENATTDQQLELCHQIIQQGAKPAASLVLAFDKIGLKNLTPDQSLKLCFEIINQGEESSLKLISSDDKIGIDNLGLEQRFELCKIMANQGVRASSAVISNFNKLGLEKAPSEQQLELCRIFVKQNCAIELLRAFNKFNLKDIPQDQRLEFFHTIISQGRYQSEIFIKEFDKLDLNRTTTDQRLKLCIEIAKQGAAPLLIDHLHKFNLGNLAPGQILQLYLEIAKQGNYSAIALIKNIETLGLSLDLDQKLTLYKELAKQGEKPAAELVNHLSLLDQAGPADRLGLYLEIARQGKNSALALVDNYKQYNMKDFSLDQLFELCQESSKHGIYIDETLAKGFLKDLLFPTILKIDDVNQRFEALKNVAALGEESASELVRQFTTFGLDTITIDQRLELYRKIMEQRPDSGFTWETFRFVDAVLKINNIDERVNTYVKIAKTGNTTAWGLACSLFEKDLGLESATSDQRLKIYLAMASQGEKAAKILATKFNELKLESIEQRLLLCHEIVRQGDYAANSLANNFSELGLENLDVDERLQLCQAIAEKGERSASYLAANFKNFGLEKADVEKRLDLCRVIVKQGFFAVRALVDNLDKFGLENATKDQNVSLAKVILKNGDSDHPEIIVKAVLNFLHQVKLDDRSIMGMVNFLGTLSFGLQAEFCNESFFSLMSNETAQKQALLDFLKNNNNLPLVSGASLLPIINILKDESETISQVEIDELIAYISNNPNLAFLENILSQINKEPIALQPSLIKWVAYTAGVFNDLKLTESQVISVANMVNHIYLHRNPNNRDLFIRALSDLIVQYPDELKNLSPKNKNDYMPFSYLMTSQLKALGLSSDLQKELLNRLERTSGFDDTKQFTLFANLISAVILNSPYKKNELEVLVQGIIKILGESKPLSKPLPEMDATKQLYDKKILNLMNAYLNPIADTVPNKNKILEQRKIALTVFVDGLTSGKRYISKAAESEIQAKLPTISDIEIKSKIEQYLRDFEPKAVTVPAASKVVGVEKDTRKEEFNKIVDNLSVYGNILAIFGKDELIKCVSENRDYHTILLENFNKLFDVAKVENLNDKFLATFGKFRNQNAIFNYLKSINSLLPGEKEAVKAAFNSYIVAVLNGSFEEMRYSSDHSPILQKINDKFPEFLNKWKDIKLVSEKSVGKFKIKVSHDPCDLLLIGTEVQGSCQSINGEPNINKCLVSYLNNGEIQAIVAKEESSDKMMARGILRFFWDEINQIPVALLERLYSNVKSNKALEEAFINLAKEKADSLNVPLISLEVGSGVPYRGRVEYLGGLAPFIYSDAAGGVQKGPFQITNSHILK
jgi:hypothetical protein